MDIDLIKEVNCCTLGERWCGLWWLGQHSFIIKLGHQIIYVDPFLSSISQRKMAPVLLPEQISNADFILGSHDHIDHIDREAWPVIARRSPKTRFIVPDLLKERLSDELKIAPDRFVGLDDGKSFTDNTLKISGIASAHEFLDREEQSGRYPYLGYVMESNGCCIYHSGDLCNYDGLRTKLERFRIDIAILPINGRDAARLSAGCIGNMSYQEAVELAGDIRAGLVIPSHYGMFDFNTEDPALFVEYAHCKYPWLKTMICEYGRQYAINVSCGEN